jgi:hypothetical protein
MGSFTYYSFNTYIRWKDLPVVLGFDEQMIDVFEIPFPAVSSSCFSGNKPMKSYRILSVGNNLSKLEIH